MRAFTLGRRSNLQPVEAAWVEEYPARMAAWAWVRPCALYRQYWSCLPTLSKWNPRPLCSF